ncbi:MAG: ruvA [Rhodospirillales bacterium]|nr:ruvA [Rhodospirillales bacterium]
MIAKLTGRIDSISQDGLVLDVNGVGYLVFCSTRTSGAVSGAAGPVSLAIETHVREDHIHLYGFIDEAERSAFRLLTTVQGVGAKLALAILSTVSADMLAQAIAAGDRAALTQAPGVGPKLALRLLTELKDKVATLAMPMTTQALKSANDAAPAADEASGATADAVSALVNLGYGRTEAYSAVVRAAKARGEASVEVLIRDGLAQLAGGARV